MSSKSENVTTEGGSELSSWALIRRMMALAWQYRWGCIKVVTLQIILLVFGLLGLGLMGLGVDYIRYHASTKSGSGPNAVATRDAGNIGQPAPAVTASAAGAPGKVLVAKPPRWPFGLKPPPDWPPMKVIGAIAVAILLMAATRSVLNIAYTLSVNRLVQGQIVVDLRSRVYDKMQRLSFRFFDANASSSLINRVTGDVQAVRGFVDGVVMQSLVLTLSLGVYLAYMTGIHAGLTLACLATIPLLWLITSRFSRMVRPAYNTSRELFDRAVQVISENVTGIQVIKGFAREREEIARFADINREMRDQKNWIFRQVSRFQPTITFLTHVNLVVMLGYGGYLVVCYEQAPDQVSALRVGLSVGQLLVFTGLLQQFSGQVANTANIANSIQQSLIGARRVFEVLDTPVEIQSPADPVHRPRALGRVEFEDVCFAYSAEDPVLEHVRFAVEPGECVAILGATGSGKSTLLSLIPRFYDATAGRVAVDGIDVRRIDLEDLRRNIGLVFQQSFLFSNTIAANIAFGHPEATREQIERAARIAAAHDFIAELPQGYETVLHEGGANLSGGQRQRLAIARALLLEPAILLLDDPTAAVDSETEGEILEAVDRAMKGRTTFIVTHRLSALRRADRVIVLDKGHVVQIGSHGELMSRKGHYRRAAQLQVPDEESSRLLGEPMDFGGVLT